MNIYVASSWRNRLQPLVVRLLREWGHEVYDFRAGSCLSNEEGSERGFSWSEVDPTWQNWDVRAFERGLGSRAAVVGFERDEEAMRSADCCVLVLPCGRSAHLEAGWFAGKGKPVVVYFGEEPEPELMYRFFLIGGGGFAQNGKALSAHVARIAAFFDLGRRAAT